MALKTRYTVVNGEVLSENRGGTIRDYVPDPLGSTVALLDNTQAQQSTFSYWPYGEVKTSSGPTSTPFQFVGTRGYYRDSASKEYVRARYLDTQKGRWLTQDPVGFEGGDRNLYRYVENGPTSQVDPAGQFPCSYCIPLCVHPLTWGLCLDCLALCGVTGGGGGTCQRPTNQGPYCDQLPPGCSTTFGSKGGGTLCWMQVVGTLLGCCSLVYQVFPVIKTTGRQCPVSCKLIETGMGPGSPIVGEQCVNVPGGAVCR